MNKSNRSGDMTGAKLWLSVFALALISSGNAFAFNPTEKHENQEPSADASGHIEKKIKHRLADQSYELSPFANSKPSSQFKAAPTAGSTNAASSPISYHGGPVMTSVSKVVVIWYGNWNQNNGTDNAAGQQIIRDALYGLSAAPSSSFNNYSGITTGKGSALGAYTQSNGYSVNAISSPLIQEFTQATNSKFGGTRLSDANVLQLVQTYAGTPDANAIYLVLSSSDIAETSGFLTNYCGWHTYATMTTSRIAVKYGFIGNPNKNLSACAVQSVSPNGNAAVDAMVAVIAHELEEATTDPQLNAWYNSAGYENADMCAWTYGSRLTKETNGSYSNVTLPNSKGGSRRFLLNRALSAKDSKCYIDANGAVQ